MMVMISESLTYSQINESRPRSCHKGGIKMKVNSAGREMFVFRTLHLKCVLQTKGHYSENAICFPSWLSSASPTSTPCESTCPWPSSPWSTTAPSSRRTPCPTLLTLAPCRRVRKTPPRLKSGRVLVKNFDYLSRSNQSQQPESGRPLRLGSRATGHHFRRLLLGIRLHSDSGRNAGGALRREAHLRPRHPRHVGLHHPDTSGGAGRLRFAHHLQVTQELSFWQARRVSYIRVARMRFSAIPLA